MIRTVAAFAVLGLAQANDNGLGLTYVKIPLIARRVACCTPCAYHSHFPFQLFLSN